MSARVARCGCDDVWHGIRSRPRGNHGKPLDEIQEHVYVQLRSPSRYGVRQKPDASAQDDHHPRNCRGAVRMRVSKAHHVRPLCRGGK